MLFSKLNYETLHLTEDYTPNYKIYLKKNSNFISILNDIPLRNKDNTYNMICEIPKYTRKKMEINWKHKYNPIQQDINNDGSLRTYNWGDMLFNYGAFPQTWENPNKYSEFITRFGDDDPLDVIDIGETQSEIGMVYKVKILGILGMIDQNELDWKVIAININDSMTSKLNTLSDVDIYKPGVLTAIREWLRIYKVVDGKKKNKFIFNEEYRDTAFAEQVINETHNEWMNNKDLFDNNYTNALH